MKLGRAIGDVREAEADLARELRWVGERHEAERDIYHLARTLAGRCEDRMSMLATLGERYGECCANENGGLAGSLDALHDASELMAQTGMAGAALLRDLRTLYLAAQEAELAWVILVQASRAARDGDLLAVATRCHEEAELVGKWLRTQIKAAAPQVLVAG